MTQKCQFFCELEQRRVSDFAELSYVLSGHDKDSVACNGWPVVPPLPNRMCFFCGWNEEQETAAQNGLIVSVSRDEVTKSVARRIRVPVYKKVSRRQCPLIDYTWERQWTNAVNRCLSHPSEAACVSDYSGRTALHLASFNHGSPDYVALALIRANPHALIKQDSYGQTPLHYACQFRGGTNDLAVLYCDMLVEYKSCMDVLNACPAITASPLYLACSREAPIKVVKALVDIRQTIGTMCWIAPITGGEPYWRNAKHFHREEEYSTSPLSVLFHPFKNVSTRIENNSQVWQCMRNAVSGVLANQDEEYTDQLMQCCEEGSDDDKDALMILWLKCLVLLREHLQSYASGNDGALLLHLVASLKVPVPSLVDCCIQVFPEQALQRNHEGHVPLHCALLNPFFSADVFSILLYHQPQAARLAFPNGQSPLAVAVQQARLSWNNGLESLVMADPDALMTRDPTSGLYPFQQAAASLDADVSTIFRLLRLHPDVLISS